MSSATNSAQRCAHFSTLTCVVGRMVSCAAERMLGLRMRASPRRIESRRRAESRWRLAPRVFLLGTLCCAPHSFAFAQLAPPPSAWYATKHPTPPQSQTPAPAPSATSESKLESAPAIEAPAEVAKATASDAQTESAFSGFLSERYRARWTSKDEDHDLWTVLSLDWKDRKTPWIRGHALARAAADLDGRDSSAGFAFDSLSDTYDHAVEARLYDAYVELTPPDSKVTLKLGRQFDWQTPEFVRFDGAQFRVTASGPRAFAAGVYAGVPVHLDDPSRGSDSVFGAFAEVRPWAKGRVRADWMHLDDERLFGESRDQLVAASVWHTFSPRWNADVHWSRLEGEDRDASANASYLSENGKTGVRLRYYELFHTRNAQALELDPFSSVLQELFPYRQASIALTRRISEHLDGELGLEARRVRDDDDVGEFNRDFERGYATLAWRDALARGLTLSLTGDRWSGGGDGDDRDLSSLNADATYERSKDWRASLGTTYALYKYDLFSDSERDDVRTWYGRLRWKATDALSLDFLYEYEDDDTDAFHTARVGALWRF